MNYTHPRKGAECALRYIIDVNTLCTDTSLDDAGKIKIGS